MSEKLSLSDALALYTGGRYRPPVYDDKWRALARKIERSPYAPCELCFFVLFFLDDKAVKEGRSNRMLSDISIMGDDEVWDRFLSFKQTRLEQLSSLLRIQYEQFSTHLRNGYPVSLLLLGEDLDMSPALRLELAYQLSEQGLMELAPALEQFRETVCLLLRGSPEYLRLLPELAKHEEQVCG